MYDIRILCVFIIYVNGLMWLWHSISSGSFDGYFITQSEHSHDRIAMA